MKTAAPLTVHRHKTAMGRSTLSRPIQLALSAGLISPESTVLDYGCGRGDDVRTLGSLGFDCVGWDPVLFQNSAERESVSVQGFGRAQTRHSRSTWGVLDPVLRRRTIGSYVKHYHLERCHQGSEIVRSKSFQNPPRV